MQARPASETRPIGVFDSGVGGLSIVREIRRRLPHETVLYFADQAHVPYGTRTKDEVRDFSRAILRFLLSQAAKVSVIACNTASAAALHSLRQEFPDHAIVGMEPAVKPAAESTRTRRVGVLATPATFQGELFASVVERFARGVEVIENTAPGLVERIEAGDLDGPATRAIIEAALKPILARGADTLVLGCTHDPFVIPLLAEVAGPSLKIIDPAPAIARQTGRVLAARGLEAPDSRPGELTLLTSGDPGRLAALAPRLIGESPSVRQARWTVGKLGIE
ncbi:MAG: glutamate racemase [Anaerolineales bacterium]